MTAQKLSCNFSLQELQKQRLVQVYSVDGIKVVKIRMAKPTVAQNIANSAVHHSPDRYSGSPLAMSPGTTAASRKSKYVHYS